MDSIEKADTTDISISDESQRTFEAWGCVNVVDKSGELVPVERVAQLMPIYMKRGGILMDSHSGRHVGKVDKWELKFNEKANADGIYLYGRVYNDLKIDDAIWNYIKDNTYKGISIGGQDFGKSMQCDQSRCFNKIDDMEFWEFSLVESPANKQAWITGFNKIAKIDNEEPKPKESKSWKTREKLAELEHKQWIEWSKNIAKKEKLSPERMEKWAGSWLPYEDLSEKTKDKDRKYADKVIEIIYGKEIKKNIVIPDPTVRGIPNEKIVDTLSTPTYQNPTAVQSTHIAPVSTVGTPLAESEKRKQLVEKLIKKAEILGYQFKKEGY